MPLPLPPKSTPFLVPGITEVSSSASTRFAFKLFRELTDGHDTNLLFSPSSVMLCALMIHEAAAGDTRQALANALEIANLDEVDTQLTVVALKAVFGWQKGAEVMGANSLWCNHFVHIRPEFAAKLREFYDAEIVRLDFSAPGSISSMNTWIRERTKGKIVELVDELSPLAAVIALNAIHFKGLWTAPFEPALTSERPFATATGGVKYLQMMCRSGSYSYCEDRGLQAIVLPYRDGMAMYVILPAAGVQSFEGLSSGAWELLLTRFKMAEGTIQMPRFKIDCRVQLEPALKNLGMERAFDRKHAEFDGIGTSQDRVWIEQVLHRAVAAVSEEGTVAAATTGFCHYFGTEDVLPSRFEMIVDRPFLVVIRDQTTGTILFMGWITNPE